MMKPRRDSRGFTLIELMVVVAVVGIVLTVAVPSFAEAIARMRMEGAVGELATDLQFARSEALRRNENVTLTVNSAGSAYTVAGASATDDPLKTVTLPTGVSLTANATVTFSAMNGLAGAPASFTASSSAHTASQLRVDSDVMGRMSTCAPSGHAFSGYSSC